MFGKTVGVPASRMITIAILLGGIFGDSSYAASAASSASTKAAEPCQCTQTRQYTKQPTPAVLELFRAAQDGDEAVFMQRLSEIPNVADYAVDDAPLVETLLYPAKRLHSDKTYEEMDDAEAARILAKYRESLPAKTRMLKAALEHGASASDITVQSSRPPLHMAFLYGSPEMVRLLLEHHTDPNLKDLDGKTPLEFFLGKDFEFAVRMTYMPPLVSKAERSEMVIALLKAGAHQPYQGLAKKQNPKLPRPAADYLIWNALMTLTEGEDVVRAMMATGTKPVYDDVATTPLAYAAWTGNLGGVIALKATTPRTYVYHEYDGKAKHIDAWLDAAMFAMRTKNDAVLEQLIVPGMPFDQVGPERDNHELPFIPKENIFQENTLMQHAIESGQTQWVRRLATLGASINAVAPEQVETPLYLALKRNDAAMAALLIELGADPSQGYFAKETGISHYRSPETPFDLALGDDNPALVQTFLAKMSKEQKLEINQRAYSPYEFFVSKQKPNALKIAQLLVADGITPAKLNPGTLSAVISKRNAELARYLIEHGAPVEPDRTVPLRASDAEPGNPPMTAAILTNQKELVALLIKKGAHPDFAEEGGDNTVQMAIQGGDIAALDALIAAGGKLAESPTPHENPRHLIDYAIASGNIAMVEKVSAATGEDVKSACYPFGEALLDKNGYFDALQKLGLSPAQHCGEQIPLTLRMANFLLDENPLIGAQATRVAHVFSLGKDSGVNLDAVDAKSKDTILRRAVKAGRLDLVDILLQAGANPNFAPNGAPATAWLAYENDELEIFSLLLEHGADMNVMSPNGKVLGLEIHCGGAAEFTALLPKLSDKDCASKHDMSQKDATLANTLLGGYSLQDVRETDSEFVLLKDGTFEFMLTYGAVEQTATGHWQVDGDQVLFSTPRPNHVSGFKWAGGNVAAPIGIGMALKKVDGHYVVADLLSDGSAAKSGKIDIGDRLVGVGQGTDSTPVSVSGHTLDEIINMIRGQQDTQVLLDMLPANAGENVKHKMVTLVRSLRLERSADAGHVKVVAKYKGESIRDIEVAIGTESGTIVGHTEGDGAILATTEEVQGIALRSRSINKGNWVFLTKPAGDPKFNGVRSFTFEIEKPENAGQAFNVTMEAKGTELIFDRGGEKWHYVRR